VNCFRLAAKAAFRPVTATVTAMITAAAAGCGAQPARPAADPQQTSVVVAAVPAEGAAGLYIAAEDGLFARAGLRVTIKTIEDPIEAIPLMRRGLVNVASGEYDAYIAANAAGIARMRIIAAEFALGPHVQEIMTAAGSPIRSPAQLRGATIAVNALGSESTDLLYTALAPYGIKPAQVHVVAVPLPAMPAALAAHRVDAIYEFEPYVTEGGQRYGEQNLIDIDSGASTDFPVAGFGVLASWAAAHPRLVRAFAEAIARGNAIAATNLAARQRALETTLHLSPQVVAVMAAGTFPTALDPVQIQRAAALMLRYGQLRRPFAVASVTGP
jgi:NitT/TauT family transport system substrate-binding protein